MEHSNHDKHKGHSTNIFKKKFWVSLILTIPVVFYSVVSQNFFGYKAPEFLFSDYLSLILASVIFFYGGWVFIRGAVSELKAKLPGMMTLIALAILVAYVYSVAVVILGLLARGAQASGQALFWEISTLITIMLLGHWLEMRAVSSAQGSLEEISKLLPDRAEIERRDPSNPFGAGKIEIIPINRLKKGDIVFARPGSRIAADGVIMDGSSDVNESIITGESSPIFKKRGSEVIAGSINGDGSLKIKVTKIGEETFLSGIMRLVSEAANSKSRLQILADRAAFYLTIIAVATGSFTFFAWLILSSPAFAINRTVAVLVVACPHALGLAIPLVASISTAKAAKSGFLVKRRLALEAARKIDVVLFDKTGTLTEGKFSVSDFSSNETLALAAAVNMHSEHPIGKGIVQKAKEENLIVKEAKNFQRVPGRGARATVEGKEVFVGHKGGEEIVVEVGGQMVGSIKVSDNPRKEAGGALSALKRAGIKTAMITGDSREAAQKVAKELGLDEYFARVLPGQKAEKVRELQAKGLKVAMVGDGVNDAPALMQADLGIAVGAGTNVAIESAGIVLAGNDPRNIVKIIRLSKLTYGKMLQNLFWAAGYNVVAIPLAAGALAFRGIFLQPAVAAILMSLSTIIVAFNAVLLRFKKL